MSGLAGQYNSHTPHLKLSLEVTMRDHVELQEDLRHLVTQGSSEGRIHYSILLEYERPSCC